MNNNIMSDGYIVTYFNDRTLVEAMKHRAVLYVNLVSDPDGIHITPDNHVEPEAAEIAGYNVSDDDSCFCNITVVSKLGGESADGFDKTHRHRFSWGQR
jgi:hypothetical protein